MPKSLVIVESPAKAKTLARFLGRDYRVEASFGHIRDLPENADEVPDEIRDKPWGTLGVDIDGDFKPYYVVPASKTAPRAALRAALKEASEAAARDRPGPRRASRSAGTSRRCSSRRCRSGGSTFHEITARGGPGGRRPARTSSTRTSSRRRRAAASSTGSTATRCRRCSGRRCRTGLSAGRVQSVAVRLHRRARGGAAGVPERAATGTSRRGCRPSGREFAATLVRVGDERVASGQGLRPGDRRARRPGTSGTSTRPARRRMAEALAQHLPWRVTAVDERPGVERPAPPFTTSTLTQEASRKLGFSTEPDDAHRAAAEGRRRDWPTGRSKGIITYHRTDSTTLSEKALQRVGARRSARCSATSTTAGRAATRRRSATPRKRTRRSGRPISTSRRRAWSASSSRTS